jgi:hypothetical protein
MFLNAQLLPITASQVVGPLYERGYYPYAFSHVVDVSEWVKTLIRLGNPKISLRFVCHPQICPGAQPRPVHQTSADIYWWLKS